MKINLNFQYDKLNLKEIIILIPKYHTNMVSFLTPILGLYGINIKEFINDFNLKTKFINFDVIVPTRVKISKIKTYEILLKTPYIISIISNVQGFSVFKPNINILTVYKLSLIKSIFGLNFADFIHKSVYIALRKYIHLITKFNLYLPLGRTVLVKSFTTSLKSNSLKRSINSFILLKKLNFSKFGLFVTFNNFSLRKINNLKTALGLYGVSINKVKSSFISSLSSIYFSGHTFYIFSPNLSNIIKF